MRVEDLRIGNLINDGICNERVSSSMLHYLEQNDDRQYKPIPLTEEILLDCGFDKVITDCEEFGESVDYVLKYRNNTPDMFILSYCDDFSINISGDERDFGVCPDLGVVNHVHQLQNLYFVLTGQELEFKTLGK